ncbi:hypothetical protein M569_00124 [Genlisea aurea]|uniref:Uncharacterized protein n=1 Tax=Genlisea aurea TaxID=192259 RepID=S8D5F0_9LAMI|nr:hypothetical protein M569_00124 [Genlisea aurea]
MILALVRSFRCQILFIFLSGDVNPTLDSIDPVLPILVQPTFGNDTDLRLFSCTDCSSSHDLATDKLNESSSSPISSARFPVLDSQADECTCILFATY